MPSRRENGYVLHPNVVEVRSVILINRHHAPGDQSIQREIPGQRHVARCERVDGALPVRGPDHGARRKARYRRALSRIQLQPDAFQPGVDIFQLRIQGTGFLLFRGCVEISLPRLFSQCFPIFAVLLIRLVVEIFRLLLQARRFLLESRLTFLQRHPLALKILLPYLLLLTLCLLYIDFQLA